MWSPVSGCGTDSIAPSARTKHSATLVGGHVYLIGGRNGNLPLKDMWKYDIVDGKWYQLQPSGDKLPCLQEHTAVAYKDGIYVFGGEMGFSSATETPLWHYDIKRNVWRKIKTPRGVAVPHGRRGHSALIHRGAMLIYGGYQDLKGSSNELWSFHFETESWHLLSSKKTAKTNSHHSECLPPARHKHSAVMHDDAMWVYGGMTDLVERNDLWKWCTVAKMWHQYKCKHNPGPLHSHAVCKLPGAMLLFGGECGGQPTNDLWKFSFALETWEKIQIDGLKPQPRAESKAFAVSELVLKQGNVQKQTANTDSTKVVMRNRTRTSTSADRTQARHSSYLPQNKVTPSEKTYVFQPTMNNYIDGSDESFHKSLVANSGNTTYKSAQPGSFLREIQKLSQLNLSKLSHNKCSYSVLNSANTESQESLLRQHAAGVLDENQSVTPVRNTMVKSQSAHFAKQKRFSCQMTTNDDTQKNSQRSCKPPTSDDETHRFALPREPISVPNFSTLVLPTPVLTPVEAAKLVYLDSEEDDDLQDPCLNLIDNNKCNYDTFKPAMRDDSYSSHLCASIYQNIPKSASVKFQCPELTEEVSDENGSTSDYASVEKVNKANERKTEEYKKGILKTTSEGPFGFANPHYMGPDVQEFLTGNNRHSWNVCDTKAQQYAKLLNTPDSGVGDMSSAKSNSRHMFLMDEVEMQQLDTRVNNEGKTQIDCSIKRYHPPTTLTLTNDANRSSSGIRRSDKTRASSASRAERAIRDKRVLSPEPPKDVIDISNDKNSNVQLYVFVIGGKEQGQITVFKRPISIWRLKLY